MADTTTIPTLTTTEDATNLMAELAASNEWVAVFWDRGWGDSGQPVDISIIVDGDGQNPKAWITPDVYTELLKQHTIAPNSLQTFKARRIHDFKSPPKPEPQITPSMVAEQTVRDLMAQMDNLPLQSEFFRGLDPNSRRPRIMHEHDYTGTAKQDTTRYVRLHPVLDGVIVSAHIYTPGFGMDLVGEVTTVPYPAGTDGEPNMNAIRGTAFRDALAAVVREKLATIPAAA